MSKISFDEIGEIIKSMDTHLGRQILINLKKNSEKINQINMTTGESESHGSVRLRSIRVAQALTSRGIGLENVLMLCGTNHNDLTIPVISSLYIGTSVLPLSVNMTHMEIKFNVELAKPDIIFCDAEVALKFQKVITELKISPEIVVFGKVPDDSFTPFEEFLKPTGTEAKFRVTDLDTKTFIAFIIMSSGTTGMSKGVCLTHQNLAIPLLLPKILGKYSLNLDDTLLTFSSYVWLSGILMCLISTILGTTRIQTHLPFTAEIAIDAINKYKPYSTFVTPTIMAEILKSPKIKDCDFSCFHNFFYGGSSSTYEKVEEMQKYVVNTHVGSFYGSTETGIFTSTFKYKRGSCGQPRPWYQWKIVDPETRTELGPNKVGELMVKSPWAVFKGYYNNPEATAKIFDGDWCRTGDLLYYDEEGDFYMVDRIKAMIKFRNYQVPPAELEQEIAKIPGVYAVCVVGLSHPVDGFHPAAFVQLLPGSDVTAEDIQNAVKENLSDYKHLRGGVAFLDQFPTTYSGKINRKALNNIKMSFFNPTFM